MKDFNRARLQRVLARFEQRRPQAGNADDALLEAGFVELARRCIEPLMREIAAELREGGHSPTISWSEREGVPTCIELALGLRGARGSRNVVGFAVIRRGERPLEVQAYLEVSAPQFDLDRFSQLGEIRPDVVERILLQAIEHIVTSNAP